MLAGRGMSKMRIPGIVALTAALGPRRSLGHTPMMRNAIILLALAVPAAAQAAECSPGNEARRCYLGVPASVTKEAEATRPARHRRSPNNAPKCQGFGGPGCFLRVE